MSSEYSEKEMAMIRHFGVEAMVERIPCPTAAAVYRRMAAEAFLLREWTGPHSESLRRCLIAMRDTKISRPSAQWDEMIKLTS